jgi:GcrA cell cycle regulator
MISSLRVLWTEGHSTAEIGRRLGVSKNAVVGKAHRLDLPSRPSPIPPKGMGRRSRPRRHRSAGPTLPPLSSAQPTMTVIPAVPAPRPKPVPAPRPYGRVVTCCWPIGAAGTREFHFCDAESVPGKPYCSQHCGIAYRAAGEAA